MRTEQETMLAGELYDPLDPDLIRARHRARDLCRDLNATREADQKQDCIAFFHPPLIWTPGSTFLSSSIPERVTVVLPR